MQSIQKLWAITLDRAGGCRVAPHRKWLFHLGTLVWLVASATAGLADTYYLDPVNGDDSVSGTSQQLAWRSLANVSAQSGGADTIVIVNFDNALNGGQWPSRIYQSASIHQFGITWSFERGCRIGRFANGDYWVVGPVAIVGISPASTNNNGRIRHGAMVNPSPRDTAQGYDSAMPYNKYDASLNAALNVSPGAPLVLSNPCSLVSTQSVTSGGQMPQIDTAAVLTILDAPAPQGAFRPAYSGTDKSIRHSAGELDYSLLKNLAPVGGTPTLETAARYFERPWLDHQGGWTGRFQHPAENMPDYGREIATKVGVGALMLHLDFSQEQKATLLYRYIQLGIDLHGVAMDGGRWNWNNDGGHAGGRKWPILFAGLMLNDDPMKSIGAKSGDYLYQGGYGPGHWPPDYVHFGEDDQTFYVSQADVDVTNGSAFKPDSRDAQKIPYTAADIGLPEWGIRHSTYPQFSNKWLPTLYRSVAGPPFHGLALPALLMDARELWNHDAFFDYTDRYMGFSASGGYSGYTRTQNSFTTNMWDAYRSQCGPVWSGSEADSAPVTPPDDGSDDGTPANSEPPETDPISGAAPLPQDEPPSLELVEPRDGDIVTGVVAIQVEATDAEDTPGTLLVEICIDSELWLEAAYSGVSGMYHVRWDATDWADGLEHTIFARATDHAPEQNTTDTSPVTVVVQPATMHVASIAVTGTQNGVSARRIQAVVAVVDGKGNPVPQALVIGTFEGVAVESASGLTNARGVAVLSGPEESGVAGPTRFYLDEVTHSGYEYRPDQNAVNAGSTAD